MIKIGNKTVLDIGIGGKAVQKVEIDDKIAYEIPDYLCFTDVSGAANTLSLTKTNTSSTISPDLEYSTDRLNWNTWTETEYVRSVSIPANGRVWLRGNCTGYNGDFRFSSTGNINADGDIMTIINKSGTTIVPYMGFASLFRSMSTLKKAPAINASHFERLACTSMFQACYNLNDVSNIKIINPTIGSAGNTIFGTMFADCSYLTSAPEISINNFWNHEHVFSATFNNCIRLTDISKLHITATVAPNNTFYHTFKGCTSLQTGLNISSVNTTGTTNVFEQMYNGCTSLTTAYAPTITWDTTKTIDWLNNVAASGTLIADDSISSTIPTNNTSGCPTGWTLEETHTYFYFEDRSGASNEIGISKTGDQTEWLTLEYSTDKQNWNNWDFSQTISLAANSKVWLRGDNTKFSVSSSNYHSFSSTGNVYAGGSVRSLFNKNIPTTMDSSVTMFGWMFSEMTNLVGVETNLFTGFNYGSAGSWRDTTNMFYRTFSGCSSLVTPPDLSGIGYARDNTFRETFNQCTSLTTAAAMNITETSENAKYSFRSMYFQCYNLVDASSMSVNCSSTNDSLFYQTFMGDNKLVTPPNFTGITVLGTKTFWKCFYSCTSLTSLNVGFTQWGSDVSTDPNFQATYQWTYNVNTNGTFTCSSALPQTKNSADNTTTSDYIPYNWTVQNI